MSLAQPNLVTTPQLPIGTIGGGQLAWMMAIAAKRLNLPVIVQTAHPSDTAVAAAQACIFAAVDDAQATAELATQCRSLVFENEFVDLDALQPLADHGVQFYPPIAALRPLLDKYEQRCYLRSLGLPQPGFCELSHPDRLDLDCVGGAFPVVMKSRRLGYDGQGTAIAQNLAELTEIWTRWGQPSVELEAFVPFVQELAIVAARDQAGQVVVYPLIETQQVQQVCRRAIAPAAVSPTVISQCQDIAHTLLAALDVVGVFAIELFLTADDRVLINEIAPRTHNSGHLTIEACHTSQFEQMIRVAADLPLGDVGLTCTGAVMVNLLGFETSTTDYADLRSQLAQLPHATVHWYGKTARPGRKLGHVTVTLDGDAATLRDRALQTAATIEKIWYP